MTRRKKTRRTPRVDLLPDGVGRRFVMDLRSSLGRVNGNVNALDYLRKEIFSKFTDPDPRTSDERRCKGIEKFLRADSRNQSTNIRLFVLDGSERIAGVRVVDVIKKARSSIASLIGTSVSVSWDILPTNGASTRVRRSPHASFEKLSGKAHCTDRALPHWLDAIDGTMLEFHEGFVFPEIVPGSVLFTVPKNSEIDRVACKEPEINSMLQRCVGETLRRRLLEVGIDLLDQSRNRAAARSASLAGSKVATIDLSSASDLISHELVRQLLPPEWFELLDDLRCHTVDIDGERHELSMFSSMGNGFTFELETLIFWSLARAVQYYFGIQGKVLAYGDDIVVNSRTGRLLRPFFAMFGFILNRKKTYFAGPFRESCGGHYYNGRDITPFYVRSTPTTQPELINYLNQIRRWTTAQCKVDDHALWSLYCKYRGVIHPLVDGGWDVEDRTMLATPRLRKEIWRFSEQRHYGRSFQPERLMYWFLSKERVLLPVETQDVLSKGRYDVRRQRVHSSWAREPLDCTFWFIQELQ